MADESFDTKALVESVEQVLGDLLDVRGRQRVADGDAGLAQDIWSTARALGWLSIGVSEENGGLGLGVRGLAALQRALGAAVTPGPLLPTLVAAQWLDEAGEGGDVVSALVGGDASAAVPADFSVASRLTCSGTALVGADQLLMFGAIDACHYLIPIEDGRVLLCEGSPGRGRPVDGWDRSQGLFLLDTEELTPRAVGAGTIGAARLEALLLLLLAADSQGGAEAILAATVAYMKMREQFGQPIGAFQALKHRAANLSADVMIGARIVRQAFDQDGGGAAMLWARLAKASMTETYVRTAADATQLHGGIGYTWEHDCHLYLKRARLNEALCSSNFALRDRASADLLSLIASSGEPMEIAA